MTDDASRKASPLTEGLGLVPDWARDLEHSESAVARLVYHYDDADPQESAIFMGRLREAAAELVAAERERQRDKVRAHIGRSVMSVYGTQAECKAARDALERLLDDEA